jgi:hypothetical protein
VAPDPHVGPLGAVTIRFSEAVTGVNLTDFTLTRDGGANLLGSGQTASTSDGGVTWTLGGLSSVTAPAAQYSLTLNAAGAGITDLAGNALTTGATEAWEVDATVVGRLTFYNQSNFDRVNIAADISDDIAIAADKQALLPGQQASFANVTSYVRGINGVMIDTFGMVGTPTPGDLQFRVGTGGDASTWASGPAPLAILLRKGAGAGGSDRLTVTFPGGSIVNAWVQVTLKANAVTGLPAPDVFYFGNLVGETGNVPSGAATAAVNAMDIAATRNQRFNTSVPVTSRYDFNRDGKITTADLLVVRSSEGASLSMITAPFAAAGRTAASDALAPAVAAAPLRRPASVRSELLFGTGPIL